MIDIKYTYLHLSVFSAILCLLIISMFLFRWTDGRYTRQKLYSLSQSVKPQNSLKLSVPPPPLPDIFVTERTEAVGEYAPPTAPKEHPILPQYQALYEENSDLIGWLEIPGTLLNLPVMHTPEDGEYYLYRLFDRSDSQYGIPFLDGSCSVTPRSTNLILHGHHMRDGTMFNTLEEYQDKSFYESHPKIRFDTIYEDGWYEVISVFLTVYDPKDANPDLYFRFIDAKNEQDFDRFIEQVKGLSLYNTGKTAQYGDQLITLITCGYHTENGRINLVAKKVS